MPDRAGRSHLSKLSVWATFVLICFGLGYPTLNRYDPRQLLPDAGTYAKLAQDGPANIASPFRFRVLIPYLAHSVAELAKGHTGTWDPLLFGFLLVNSIFAATTALLISVIGESLLADSSAALLASALYLLNFAIANAHLAALGRFWRSAFSDGHCRQHVLWALVAAAPARRPRRADQRIVRAVFDSYGDHLVPDFSETSRAAAACSLGRCHDCRGMRDRHRAAVHDFRPSGLALGFCGGSEFPRELRGELYAFAAGPQLLVHPDLAASSRPSANQKISARVGGVGGVAAVRAGCLNAYHSTVGGGGGGIGRYVFDIPCRRVLPARSLRLRRVSSRTWPETAASYSPPSIGLSHRTGPDAAFQSLHPGTHRALSGGNAFRERDGECFQPSPHSGGQRRWPRNQSDGFHLKSSPLQPRAVVVGSRKVPRDQRDTGSATANFSSVATKRDRDWQRHIRDHPFPPRNARLISARAARLEVLHLDRASSSAGLRSRTRRQTRNGR